MDQASNAIAVLEYSHHLWPFVITGCVMVTPSSYILGIKLLVNALTLLIK